MLCLGHCGHGCSRSANLLRLRRSPWIKARALLLSCPRGSSNAYAHTMYGCVPCRMRRPRGSKRPAEQFKPRSPTHSCLVAFDLSFATCLQRLVPGPFAQNVRTRRGAQCARTTSRLLAVAPGRRPQLWTLGTGDTSSTLVQPSAASLFAGLCSGRLAAGSIGRRGKLQNGLLGQRLKTSRQLVNQTILHG